MTNVIQIGLGPIGRAITRLLVQREGINILGAVDIDPEKEGKDLGSFSGLEALGVTINSEWSSVEGIEEADLAVVATVSDLESIEPQIYDAADLGLDILSTCEELSYPWLTQPATASRIDSYCKSREVSCLSTGVNPGFLMDYLPVVLSSVCRSVDYVRVERLLDAKPRRKQFRDKIGIGLDKSEFDENRDSFRHVGLLESAHMIAAALQWELDKIFEIRTPIIAGEAIDNGSQRLEEGKVAGIEQLIRGYREGEECLRLTFRAAVEIEESRDTIRIGGDPGFESTVPGGINGDTATASIMVNAVRLMRKLPAGLNTMLDASPPACYAQR